ncbi:MAG: DUF1501 domain-containing protein [Gemmataceae bacterium]|nr:DUF1501 domain-containing protein [Gemmataceae bacterium]MCS7270654.1 DUF1501 domain-containing protein [Gemmataceae bacterium]MDW8241699.1 DUF1501 domain-containing protein [Thermogemmata sp.]
MPPLTVGQQRSRLCSGLHRRAFLQVGASTVLGWCWSRWLAVQAASPSVPTGSARAVILVWLWGGPSQLDTFDPKPHAPLEYRGPFGTIPTRISGVRFCELFPQLAARTDRLAVVRTLTTVSNDHGIAGTVGLTGSGAGGVGLDGKPLPGSPQPALGSIVARSRAGQRRQGAAGLHPFFVIGGKMHQGKKPIIGEGGGVLGAAWDPFRLEYDPVQGTRIPALQLPPELTPERFQHRQGLLQALDDLQRQTEQLVKTQKLTEHQQRVLAMLTAPQTRAAFDVSQEPAAVVERYGRTRFGQSCLLARRLVEAGVPFVQVNWSDHVEAEEDAGDGGWDHHYRNFQIMQDRHAPWLDHSLSALLDDLHDRGLLSSTLVLAYGEFGRTPLINDKAGRDHWPDCFCALVAGGGLRSGCFVGTSDAKAAKPADTPLTPADLHATVLHQLGLTSEQITSLGLTPQGRVITELL